MPRFIVTVRLEVEADDAYLARESVADDLGTDYINFERSVVTDVEPGSLPVEQ